MTTRWSSSLAALGMVVAPAMMKFADRHPADLTSDRRGRQQSQDSDEAETAPVQRHCGVERWSIKVGSDGEARDVDLHQLREATIAELRGLKESDDADTDARIQPTEESVYVLRNVKLTHYKRESDSDYHLVLEDAHGNTMIAEIPEPGCVSRRSPWRQQIRAVRAAFDEQHDVAARMASADDTVSLIGVGFFDFVHGQAGVAPNGIELHPVLDICFGTDCKLELATTP